MLLKMAGSVIARSIPKDKFADDVTRIYFRRLVNPNPDCRHQSGAMIDFHVQIAAMLGARIKGKVGILSFVCPN